jgi:hypothetical protein
MSFGILLNKEEDYVEIKNILDRYGARGMNKFKPRHLGYYITMREDKKLAFIRKRHTVMIREAEKLGCQFYDDFKYFQQRKFINDVFFFI